MPNLCAKHSDAIILRDLNNTPCALNTAPKKTACTTHLWAAFSELSFYLFGIDDLFWFWDFWGADFTNFCWFWKFWTFFRRFCKFLAIIWLWLGNILTTTFLRLWTYRTCKFTKGISVPLSPVSIIPLDSPGVGIHLWPYHQPELPTTYIKINDFIVF